MAKNTQAPQPDEPRAVSPEELAPEAATTSVTEAVAPRPNTRRGIVIGSTIAGGVLALGLGFGTGYIAGQAQHSGPDFSQMQPGDFDGDGDAAGGFGGGPAGPGGHGPQGQNQSGSTQQNQSGSSSNGTNSTKP
ncbi:MAG: hypothetical protein ACOYBP_03575 [Microbacteriaceae bacterium]